MKEYLLLYKSKYNDYHPTEGNISSSLWDINEYYFRDDRYYNDDIFTRDQSHYNSTILVNDFENKNIYIVAKDFDIENHIPDDERLGLTNETNSCKISVDNFKEFTQKWIEIKKALPPFAIIYRDDLDWVHCKGFDSKEEMKLFIKNYQPEETH